ncbi:MAG TPA: HAMP domain-containing sensor histidine kinase, partial [Lacunisphaera sp.]|nr:HAMP domain-containing sensor histidine kinase [Lacunisphaera sp.]
MKQSDIYLAALPEEALGVAREAARRAFPGSRIIARDRLDDVLRGPHRDGARLLVLADPAAVAATSQLKDASGSPQWAMVVLGRDSSELAETVSPEEWQVPLLARVFRSVLLEHQLLRENLRLQGDLRTVARRVSHDLRTPVGCIHTTADVLTVDASSVEMMADVIRQSSAEISRIVDRVSFVLKATVDPTPPAPVAAGEIVTAVLRQLETRISRADATIFQPDSWPEVVAVPSWLHAIWLNLIDNALQHAGPSVRVRLEWREENEEFHFSVTDSGPGIAASRVAGLFVCFDQL